ncbi:MAG: hypothetical protein O4861_07205 [Trichodesmium sp. St16_bin4-tuft]|nr:hypothetical protein [Trichodesmium sp. St5_bin8]MDE5098132.1 hypothetical protein [Trichodesmium sp. St16_bin4-tuft]
MQRITILKIRERLLEFLWKWLVQLSVCEGGDRFGKSGLAIPILV